MAISRFLTIVLASLVGSCIRVHICCRRPRYASDFNHSLKPESTCSHACIGRLFANDPLVSVSAGVCSATTISRPTGMQRTASKHSAPREILQTLIRSSQGLKPRSLGWKRWKGVASPPNRCSTGGRRLIRSSPEMYHHIGSRKFLALISSPGAFIVLTWAGASYESIGLRIHACMQAVWSH